MDGQLPGMPGLGALPLAACALFLTAPVGGEESAATIDISLRQPVAAATSANLTKHGDIRTYGGEVGRGQVEIFYDADGPGGSEGTWGTICHNAPEHLPRRSTVNATVTVACRQLGYSGGSNNYTPMFYDGPYDVLLTEFNCDGDETRLVDCDHTPIAMARRGCDHRLDITLICTGDRAAALTVDDAAATESEGQLLFEVKAADVPSSDEVTVRYETADRTAVSGEDYAAVSGTLTFTSTLTVQTVAVPVHNDMLNEPDEELAICLVDATNGVIDRSAAMGTIRDDDEPTEVKLTVEPSEVHEDAGATTVDVSAELVVGTRAESTTVSVSVSGSGQAGAVDFAPVASFTITIDADVNSGSGSFTLTPEDDAEDEVDETISVTGTSHVPVVAATLALVDDDEPSTSIALALVPTAVTESAGATSVAVTATLDADPRTTATTVSVSVAGSGEEDAVDFEPVPSFTVTITAGETSATGSFTLTPEDDNVDEVDETVSVTGSSALPVTPAGVTLRDDDKTSSRIDLTVNPTRLTEDQGATPVQVTASLDGGGRTKPTTVTVAVAGSGGADAVDFEAVASFTVTIAAGDTSGTGSFTLTPEDDNVDEVDETVSVAGSSNLPVTPTVLTLADDDEASTGVLLSVAPTSWSEGGGSTEVRVTATLNANARTSATTVAVSAAGSGGENAVDFEAVPSFTITIGAGETSAAASFTLTPLDDTHDGPDETISVTGTSDLPVVATELVLLDDEATSTAIMLTTAPSRVAENDGATTVAVTATLDADGRVSPTTVAVEVSAGGAADAVDFEAVPAFTITVGAGETSATGSFTLTPLDDDLDEDDETISVTGMSDLPVAAAELTLVDDDRTSTRIELTVAPSRVTENDGETSIEVTAMLDAAGRTSATTVDVQVSGSGGADAVDFEAVPSFAITIAAGASSGTGSFTLSPVDDNLAAAVETISVTGTSDLPVAAVGLTLLDDDEASTRIRLSVAPASVSEGAGATEVSVTADLDAAARAGETVVSVTVAGSGAANAVDHTDVADFTLTIAALETRGSGAFTLVPEDDNTVESTETLTVSGTADLDVTGASLTITDDDSASTRIDLSAAPARVSEGGGAAEVTVTAALNGAARTAATDIAITVAGGGDPTAVDHGPVPSFALVIPADETTGAATFTLTPEDDATDEADETLTVSGTADLPVEPTMVVLADDDAVSTRILLAADPGRVSEDGGATLVTVTASLDGGRRPLATTVGVSVAGTDDPAAVDFEPVPGFDIVIPADAPAGTGTFTLLPANDVISEADETLTVSGTSDLPVEPATVALADDDDASTAVLLSLAPARVSEDAGPTPVTVTASLNRGRRTEATTVRATVGGGGDPAAVDFAPVPAFPITIPAGAASGSATFTLVPEDDATTESDATLTVAGSADLPVESARLVLADDDEVSRRIRLSVDPTRVSEGAGATPVTVTASLDRGRRQVPTAVRVSVAGGGAPDAADFGAVSDFEIVIPANAARGTATFTLVPEDDRNIESDETLTITGVSDLPVAPVDMTLVDDDEESTRILLFLSVDPTRVSEGDGPARITVTASLDRAVRTEATAVSIMVAGTGDPAAVDFDALSGLDITIPTNELSGAAAFTVTPEDDRIVETDETVTISGTSDLPVTPATLTILDDDEAAIVLSVEPSRLAEGDGATTVEVTATLEHATRQTATSVTVSVTGSGNPGAVDFESVADFPITIPAGGDRDAGTFILVPEDDDTTEADETLTVSGVADVSVAAATITLLDDDEGTTELSVADATVGENGGELDFVAALARPSRSAVAVDYLTVDDTAVAGADYTSVVGTLSFASGEVAKTVRVAVLDDDIHEGDERLLLVLRSPTGAALVRDRAVGTIIDDDTTPTLTITDANGAESDAALAFTLRLSAPSAGEVTIGYATADGTAEAGSDYESVAGTLTLAPGELATTVEVPLTDDALDEVDVETFLLTLSDPIGAELERTAATGSIRDDDATPTLSVADADADETVGSLAFVVTLSAPSGIGVSTHFATADRTATAGEDYTAARGRLTFPPGEVARTVRVAVVDDSTDEPDEAFALLLSDPVGATLSRGSAVGTIRDDDLAPPASAARFPDLALCVAGAPHEFDLAEHIAGEELRFAAASSAPGVASVALNGSRLTVAGVSEGEATVTVTATNPAGALSVDFGVRVVVDPAELAAVDAVLASIGRGVLRGVSEVISDRIGERDPSANHVTHNMVPVPTTDPTMSRDRPGHPERYAFERPDSHAPSPIGSANPPSRDGFAPFVFSLDQTGGTDSTGGNWAVWARGGSQRFAATASDSSHDGRATSVHFGADAHFGDWLVGASVSRIGAEANYRFDRSLDACGTDGVGEGVVEAELTSFQPYSGRRIGKGWVWASLGVGRGEVSVKRCDSGDTDEADLSTRLVALGGRHPFGGGSGTQLSVVEEMGYLELTSADTTGPAGDRSIGLGQVRLGLEAAGVVPADCECSLSTFARAFARGDWGHGTTGAGLELVAGVRYRNVPIRLGLEATVHTLAVHSADDVRERGANLTMSILPRADGTGLQADLAWRRDPLHPGLDNHGAAAGWTGRALRAETEPWIAETRVGFGIATTRGHAVPFLAFDARGPDHGHARLGMRHKFGGRARGLVLEWSVGARGTTAGAEKELTLTASGRF